MSLADLEAIYLQLRARQTQLIADAKALYYVSKCEVEEQAPVWMGDEAEPDAFMTEGIVKCRKYGFKFILAISPAEYTASEPLREKGYITDEEYPSTLSIGSLLIEKDVDCMFGGSPRRVMLNTKPLLNDPDMPSDETSYQLLRRYHRCETFTDTTTETDESKVLSLQLVENGYKLLSAASLYHISMS